MKTSESEVRLRRLRMFCVCGLLAAIGCGGLKVVPVSGKVTLDKKPLPGVVLSFNPDQAKGNAHRISATGRVGGNGQYEIYTDDGTKVRKGAPPGWYKVTLLTGMPGAPAVEVDGKYLDVARTPWSVEVVADPPAGAYDFDVTR
jgi:hypothetical protein